MGARFQADPIQHAEERVAHVFQNPQQREPHGYRDSEDYLVQGVAPSLTSQG